MCFVRAMTDYILQPCDDVHGHIADMHGNGNRETIALLGIYSMVCIQQRCFEGQWCSPWGSPVTNRKVSVLPVPVRVQPVPSSSVSAARRRDSLLDPMSQSCIVELRVVKDSMCAKGFSLILPPSPLLCTKLGKAGHPQS